MANVPWCQINLGQIHALKLKDENVNEVIKTLALYLYLFLQCFLSQLVHILCKDPVEPDDIVF